MKPLILILVFVIHFATANSQTATPIQFEELQLEDSRGKIFNTSSLLGKVVYVDFWFTACAPCIHEIPYSQALQRFFAKDTNVVFLNICIESLSRKPVWKQMIQDKKMAGIHLFYARNRPQKVNLLRQYDIKFPAYIMVDKTMKVISYDMPRPSETGWVYWLINQATKGFTPHESAYKIDEQYEDYTKFQTEVKNSLPVELQQ